MKKLLKDISEVMSIQNISDRIISFVGYIFLYVVPLILLVFLVKFTLQSKFLHLRYTLLIAIAYALLISVFEFFFGNLQRAKYGIFLLFAAIICFMLTLLLR